SRRRHTRFSRDWSSDVCSSDLGKVIAVSDGVRADILQRFAVDTSQVVTIYNPVLDESQLIPKRPAAFANPPKIVALGRLTRQKRSEERRVGKERKNERTTTKET